MIRTQCKAEIEVLANVTRVDNLDLEGSNNRQEDMHPLLNYLSSKILARIATHDRELYDQDFCSLSDMDWI